MKLENDRERIGRFTACLGTLDPGLRLLVWRSVRTMIGGIEPDPGPAQRISLDHDREVEEGETDDPGGGVEVARFLASRPPVCSVIVRSSTGTRSDGMIGELELGGWVDERVAPIGDDWIEAYRRVGVRKLLARCVGTLPDLGWIKQAGRPRVVSCGAGRFVVGGCLGEAPGGGGGEKAGQEVGSRDSLLRSILSLRMVSGP